MTCRDCRGLACLTCACKAARRFGVTVDGGEDDDDSDSSKEPVRLIGSELRAEDGRGYTPSGAPSADSEGPPRIITALATTRSISMSLISQACICISTAESERGSLHMIRRGTSSVPPTLCGLAASYASICTCTDSSDKGSEHVLRTRGPGGGGLDCCGWANRERRNAGGAEAGRRWPRPPPPREGGGASTQRGGRRVAASACPPDIAIALFRRRMWGSRLSFSNG